jgi:hypothetical protein
MSTQQLQEILSCDFEDNDGENNTITVDVKFGDKTTRFYVQTVDRLFRADLGCWVYTDKHFGNVAFDKSYEDEYRDFDFDEIIEAAEYFIHENTEYLNLEYTIDNEPVIVALKCHKYEVVQLNREFVNADSSPYQREYSEPLFVSDDLNKVKVWLAENATKI